MCMADKYSLRPHWEYLFLEKKEKKKEKNESFSISETISTISSSQIKHNHYHVNSFKRSLTAVKHKMLTGTWCCITWIIWFSINLLNSSQHKCFCHSIWSLPLLQRQRYIEFSFSLKLQGKRKTKSDRWIITVKTCHVPMFTARPKA